MVEVHFTSRSYCHLKIKWTHSNLATIDGQRVLAPIILQTWCSPVVLITINISKHPTPVLHCQTSLALKAAVLTKRPEATRIAAVVKSRQILQEKPLTRQISLNPSCSSPRSILNPEKSSCKKKSTKKLSRCFLKVSLSTKLTTMPYSTALSQTLIVLSPKQLSMTSMSWSSCALSTARRCSLSYQSLTDELMTTQGLSVRWVRR